MSDIKSLSVNAWYRVNMSLDIFGMFILSSHGNVTNVCSCHSCKFWATNYFFVCQGNTLFNLTGGYLILHIQYVSKYLLT